jgi:hypothetical protein
MADATKNGAMSATAMMCFINFLRLFSTARVARPHFSLVLRSLDVFGCISLSFANDQILSIITILNDDFDIDQRTLVVDV